MIRDSLGVPRWILMAKNLRPIDVDHFRSAVEKHEWDWGVTDRALYELCRNNPGHEALSAVSAKALLIGRSFATGIERHIKSSGLQGSSIGQLARHLQKNNAHVDEIINCLREVKEPLDLQSLSAIVSGHGKFCKLLAQISRGGNAPTNPSRFRTIAPPRIAWNERRQVFVHGELHT